MNDNDLEQLFKNSPNASGNSAAKKAAIHAAMREFEAVGSQADLSLDLPPDETVKPKIIKNRNFFQGFFSRFRLIGNTLVNEEDYPMKRTTWIYGGVATAFVAVFGFIAIDDFQPKLTVIPDSIIIYDEARPAKIFPAVKSDSDAKNISSADLEDHLSEFKSESAELSYSSELAASGKGTISGIIDSEEVSVPASAFAEVEAPKPRGVEVMSREIQPASFSDSSLSESLMQTRSIAKEKNHSLSKGKKLSRRAEPEVMGIASQVSRDDFSHVEVNPVKRAADEPVSTFSADVDTASYSFVRRSLNEGRLPPKDSVRVEEMLNYFDYDYRLASAKKAPFEPNVMLMDSPWNSGNKLLHIGIKGYDIAPNKKPPTHLTFLLDVSGSMNSPDKLPLVKQSMQLLLSRLNESDTVAIVVYAGAAGVVLEPTEVKHKGRIINAMNRLQAGGSTAGAKGIQLAYQLAENTFDENAVNRIILATDGDFNVGINNHEELKGYVERKREAGIFLTVLGFGRGNYQDALMQTLAQNGNGVAAYIDTLSEAQKVLVEESSANLFTIAKDVKLQVEFNPKVVSEYRLIGYETRALKREDFNNDKVDAAEVGSGHSVTAIYEITPVGSKSARIDELRYADDTIKKQSDKTQEFGFLKIRYKLPHEDTSRLIEKVISTDSDKNDENLGLIQDANFAASVAGFAQLLKDPRYLGDWGYDEALLLAQANKGSDDFGYRTEFVQLIRKAKMASKL
ncbi:MAG: Ca-activated chloride channel family protein [Flavobacteriales bacterium]|jgi:Ca-activated chloride channel family protein